MAGSILRSERFQFFMGCNQEKLPHHVVAAVWARPESNVDDLVETNKEDIHRVVRTIHNTAA